MNIDELKMILETINSTTGLAKDFGTTWVWLHYGLKVFDSLLAVVCILGVAYAIYRMVAHNSGSGTNETFIRRCRDRLRIGSPGMLTNEEAERVRIKLSELIDKHLQEKNNG